MADSAAGNPKAGGNFFGRSLGIAGPLAMSVFWTVVIAFMVWVLLIAAAFTNVTGMSEMLTFFRDGLLLIFILILFLSYAAHYMGKEKRFLIALLPAECSAGLFAALWIASGTLQFIQLDAATTVSAYARQYIVTGPFAALAVGYAAVAILFVVRRPMFSRQAPPATAPSTITPAARPAQPENYEQRLIELKGMMREAEKKYLNRKIDRKTFDSIAKDYHQQVAEIEGKRAASAG
jgi:hypothetical protein